MMMMTTVIDVFALLPDLIKCKYPRPPIADACALVVNTLLMMTQLALTATAEVIRMRAMALSVFALLHAQQVTNNNGLLSPMRARR